MGIEARLAAKGVKVCTLDIENKPILGYTWGLFNQNISLSQIVEPGAMLSISAKFLNSPVEFYSDWDDGHEGMVRKTHALLNEADVIVGYNSDAFDLKHINWEFAKLGLPRPRPYRTIDLLKVVRREFRPTSKKLDHVGDQLGQGRKLQHEGFDLWRKAMEGDPVARRKFRRYNERDVLLTERLYMRLLPWMPPGVNIPLLAGKDKGCPYCGNEKIRDTASVFTGQTEYAAYQCSRCKGWYRSNYQRRRTSRVGVR